MTAINNSHRNAMNSPQNSIVSLLQSTKAHALILSGLAILIYSNSFLVPFVFDDFSSITDNSVIHSLNEFFTSGYAFNPRRYIGYLSLALNYHFGGINVIGYHAVNLTIHIASTLFVYGLVRLSFQTPFLRRSSHASRCATLALIAALLFVAHPLQTQAVTYIVQRFASLATMFYLAALYFHIRWRLTSDSGEPFTSLKVLPVFLLSLSAALLAMKTKEIAFTLPLIVLLYEFAFFGRPDLHRLGSLVPMLLTIVIIPLSMINTNLPAGEMLSDVSKATMTESTLSRWEYLCTQFNVVVTYIRLLFLPFGQNLDYDYPVTRTIADLKTLFSLLVLLFLFFLALLLWKHSHRNNCSVLRMAAFGIMWFFITLSVESSFIPLNDVIFEHRLYLPSVGFFIGLTALFSTGIDSSKSRLDATDKIKLLLLPAVVITFMSSATYARNNVWRDRISLYKDTVAKSPNKDRPINNLIVEYMRTGRDNEALKTLRHLLDNNPDLLVAHNNLGTILSRKGDLNGAAREFREALRINPKYPQAHNNLGTLLYSHGELDAAIREFREALYLMPDYVDAQNNLEIALKQKSVLDSIRK